MMGQTVGAVRRGLVHWCRLACLTLLIAGPLPLFGDVVCGPLWSGRGVGPADYNDPHNARLLHTVESVHFTPEIRTLQAGRTTHIGGDIRYTLNVFPNHPHALDAMSRLALRDGDPPRGSHLTTECWFRRALEFRPRDANVHLAYALHQHRHGRPQGAIDTLRTALTIEPANASLHYNLGLLLLDQGRFAEAREHAERAYRLGAPYPGLRNRLQAAGYPLRLYRTQEVEEQLRQAAQAFERGDLLAAVDTLRGVLATLPDDPEVHYDLGLMLLRLGRLDEAVEHARRAYALGFPMMGLKKALERAGYALDGN